MAETKAELPTRLLIVFLSVIINVYEQHLCAGQVGLQYHSCSFPLFSLRMSMWPPGDREKPAVVWVLADICSASRY